MSEIDPAELLEVLPALQPHYHDLIPERETFNYEARRFVEENEIEDGEKRAKRKDQKIMDFYRQIRNLPSLKTFVKILPAVICLQCTSVASERAFSTSNHQFGDNRNRSKIEKIEFELIVKINTI